MRIEEIRAEALQLSSEARANLARELLVSLEGMNEAEIERLWLEEAARRDEELDNGMAVAHPADEVFARARARLK